MAGLQFFEGAFIGISYSNTNTTTGRRRLKVNGTLTLINLLSVGNAIESINVEFQGKEYPLSWKDTHGGKPDSLAPRASRVAYFFATDMDWPFPPDKRDIELTFFVRDMFGRVYAKMISCPVEHT